MKHFNIMIRAFLTGTFLFLCGFLFSQGKLDSKGYQPELGQEGKDVRWFPTPQELVDKMLDMAKITPSDFLIDLGSGDGRTVITAAKRGIRGVGIEYNPDLVEVSKKNAIREGVKDKVDFIKTDLFNYDFSKATVLTLFLLPEINLRLRPRILNMKPGTKVVSTTFTMQNWQHDDFVTIETTASDFTTAYLWIVPAKINGTWKFSGGTLKLTQQFQMFTGEMIKESKTVKITSGRLKGSDITFNAGGTIYTGKVTGNLMKGTFESAGKTTGWAAQKLK
jgi:hypothetical protein